jgi:putative transposase
LSFLSNAHSQSIQAPLRNLERAFKDAFDKTQPLKRIPVFKKKGRSDSFSYPQGFKIDQKLDRVFLPKIGWVKYVNSRKIVGEPKNITINRKGKHWYVSIQVEYDTMSVPHKSTSIVGIDMGIKRFATLSDGTVYQPLNSFKGKSEKLAKLQRKLKNKKKFSSNWKKVRAKITQCHEKIANARNDYLHKVSTEICENQAVIVVEDLKVKNMSKSAKGSIDKPGKMVAQKSGLNKAILDQGWSMFFQMLDYKQGWNGGTVLKVPPHHTSQECPACHHISAQNRLTQAEFVCVACGFTANADDVGAINVLTRGHVALANNQAIRGLACEVNGAVMPSAAGTREQRRRKLTPESGITVSLGR